MYSYVGLNNCAAKNFSQRSALLCTSLENSQVFIKRLKGPLKQFGKEQNQSISFNRHCLLAFQNRKPTSFIDFV